MEKMIDATPETQTPQLDAINQVTLTTLVQSALDSETVEVTDWHFEQLHAGVGEWTAVYRFSGQGLDHKQTVPWSLILKVLYPQAQGDDLSAWNYYKREADAYYSGWLNDLHGGLTAARGFGVVEHPDGTCWIWLEDVTDDIGSHWHLEQYGVVARHVGQFNGAYLVGLPLPSWSWLSSGWLRAYVAQSAPTMALLRDSLGHPLVRRWLPGDANERFFSLWEKRDIYLDVLDRLPQTICHLDVFRRNLFARKTPDGGYQTVAVDWSFAGQGAIGQELVPLVQGSVALFEVGLAQAQELEDIVFEGYLEGLRDVGWRGDPKQVRLGYTAASLRYRFADSWRFLEGILDESQHGAIQQVFGLSLEELCDHWGQVGTLCDSRTDEVRELMELQC